MRAIPAAVPLLNTLNVSHETVPLFSNSTLVNHIELTSNSTPHDKLFGDITAGFKKPLNNHALISIWQQQFKNISSQYLNQHIMFPDNSTMSIGDYLQHEAKGDFLYQWRAVMAHDAATGYGQMEGPIGYSAEKSAPENVWTFSAQTQVGGFAKQLSCGARALDLRAGPVKNGVVYMHHGLSIVKFPLSDAIQEVVDWSKEKKHKDELVLLYLNKWKGAQTKQEVEKILSHHDIPLYTDCNLISHITKQRIFRESKGSGVFAVENCVDEQYDDKVKCCHVKFPLLGRRRSMSSSLVEKEDAKFWPFTSSQQKLRKDKELFLHEKEVITNLTHDVRQNIDDKFTNLTQSVKTDIDNKFNNLTNNVQNEFFPDRRFQEEMMGTEFNATAAFQDLNTMPKLFRNATTGDTHAQKVLTQKFRLGTDVDINRRTTPCCFHQSQPTAPFQRFVDYISDATNLREADNDKPLRIVQAHWQYSALTYLHQWWHKDPSLLDQVKQSGINHLTPRALHDRMGNFLEVDAVCEGGNALHEGLSNLSTHVFESFIQGTEPPANVSAHIANIASRHKLVNVSSMNKTMVNQTNFTILLAKNNSTFLSLKTKGKRFSKLRKLSNSTRVRRGRDFLKKHRPTKKGVLKKLHSQSFLELLRK